MKTIDPQQAQVKPLPLPDPDSRMYWEALKVGRLLLQCCSECGHHQVYHQAICRSCTSTQLEHREASGGGSVYSYSIVHRAPGPAFKGDTPYAVLLVELDEGPRMISSLVGAPPETTAFGMRVRLVCDPVAGEITLPRFRPDDSGLVRE